MSVDEIFMELDRDHCGCQYLPESSSSFQQSKNTVQYIPPLSFSKPNQRYENTMPYYESVYCWNILSIFLNMDDSSLQKLKYLTDPTSSSHICLGFR